MPPKKATKSSSGPSGSGLRPTLYGSPLDKYDLDMIYFAYNRYRFEGRPLLREEVCEIIGAWLHKSTPRLSDVRPLLDTFEDDEHPLSMEHQRSADGKVEGLEKDVETFFNSYLEGNPEARVRAEYLRGLSQRLVIPYWKNAPTWNNSTIEPYKLYSLYVIAKYCKNADGSEMGEATRLDVASECFFNGTRSVTSIMKRLAQAHSDVAKKIAASISVDMGFFMRRTQEVLNKRMGAEAPQVDIPPEYRGNTISSTTSALEAFSLKATAPSRPLPTGRTGYGPAVPSAYEPIAPNSYQPLSTGSNQPIQRSSYESSGPSSSRSANPGPYQSTGEDEDDEEEERAKEKEKEGRKGKEKEKGTKGDKRQQSKTPEAPGPKRRAYDPVRDV